MPLVSLTGLWKQTSKNGTEYLAGKVDVAKLKEVAHGQTELRLQVYVNPGRPSGEQSNRPHFNLVVALPDDAREQAGPPPAQAQPASPWPGGPVQQTGFGGVRQPEPNRPEWEDTEVPW